METNPEKWSIEVRDHDKGVKESLTYCSKTGESNLQLESNDFIIIVNRDKLRYKIKVKHIWVIIW